MLLWTSITADGHIMRHHGHDVRFATAQWATTRALAIKEAGAFKRPAGLTASVGELLKSASVPEAILGQLKGFSSYATALSAKVSKQLGSVHSKSIAKGISEIPLSELAGLLFAVAGTCISLTTTDPTPAEMFAVRRAISDERYFWACDDSAYNPTLKVRPQEEADYLLKLLLQKPLPGSELALFLEKCRRLVVAYRKGEILNVHFSSGDVRLIHQVKSVLSSSRPSSSIEVSAVYRGIIKGLGSLYSVHPSKGDIFRFLKEIGVFSANEDAALHQNYPKGTIPHLEHLSSLGDAVMSHSTAYCNELAEAGPFIYTKELASHKNSEAAAPEPPASVELDEYLKNAAPSAEEKTTRFPSRDVLEKLRNVVDETVFVIDDPKAHELDDGISLEEAADGDWMHIHIADPTAYIPSSHPLAALAQVRSTSVYLPHVHFPMMSSVLSNRVLNLGTSVGALTFSAKFDTQGEICDYRVAPSLIAKPMMVSYTDIDTVLSWDNVVGRKNTAQLPLWIQKHFAASAHISSAASFAARDVQTLQKLQEMAQRHMSVRVSRGGFTPDTLSYSVRVEEADVPLSPRNPTGSFQHPAFSIPTTIKMDPFDAPQRSPAHILVSEAMIIAGRVAAKFLSERSLPAAFRGQETPMAHTKQLYEDDSLAARAKELMDKARSEIDIGSGTISETAYRALIPYMGGATNSTRPADHWAMGIRGSGLDFSGYVKVTSPLRRFLDMHAHYQIQAALLGKRAPFDLEATERINAWAYKLQGMAKQLQQRSKRYWALEFLRRQTIRSSSALVSPPLEGVLAFSPYARDRHAPLSDQAVRHVAIVHGLDHNGYGPVAHVSLPYLGGLRGRVTLSGDSAVALHDEIQVVVDKIDPDHGFLSMSQL
ncbi:hypothetical protein HDU91_000026 [Kappamyces sp. JEL0680]|nr:hypothetical protein HDU91_000026 [Kappamyces sp. JEL0680]